jgi:hypothetical protein
MTMNDGQMRDYVVGLVRDTIATNGLPERPSMDRVLAALQLPPVKLDRLPPRTDGLRIGRQIVINSWLTSAERIEFTVFHEIVHLLLEEDGEIPSQLHDHHYRSPESHERWTLEALCNVGAAEFVVPAGPFSALLLEHGWKITALEAAAATFACSTIAVAFQFAHYHPDPCTVLICEYGALPDSGEPALALAVAKDRECLFVAYSAWHPRAYAMCRHVSVPRDHPIYHAWRDRTAVEGEGVGFFKAARPWKMPCEAAWIRGRVFGALYPRGQKWTPAQRGLFD